MENIKVVFIDIDNTLLDFDIAIKTGIKEGFKKYNLGEFTDEMFVTFEHINNNLWESLQRKEITFSELKEKRFDIFFKELGINFNGQLFESNFRDFLFSFAYPVDGAIDLLNYLKNKGYILCAASNGPLKQQINRLTVGQMYNYFNYIFVSEDIGYSKPSKDFFKECFSRMNNKYNSSQSIMIGDSLTSDIQGAKNANMRSIFFNKHKKDALFDFSSDYMINELKDIKNII